MTDSNILNPSPSRNREEQLAAERAERAAYLASQGYQFNPATGTWQLKPRERRTPLIPPEASRQSLCLPDEDYTDAVCLLLPGGYATVIDVAMFDITAGYEWKVMGRSIFYTQYTPVTYERRRCGIGRTGYGKFRRSSKKTFHSFHRELFLRGMPDGNQRREAERDLKSKEIDHRNRVPWDNRLANLRLATRSENAHNTPKRKRGSSQYKGVSKIKGRDRWVAKIRLKNKYHHLGTFDSEFDAARAYNKFVLKHIPEFGYLNPLTICYEDEKTRG